MYVAKEYEVVQTKVSGLHISKLTSAGGLKESQSEKKVENMGKEWKGGSYKKFHCNNVVML